VLVPALRSGGDVVVVVVVIIIIIIMDNLPARKRSGVQAPIEAMLHPSLSSLA
jgi:acid phosphatase family membrane protein YuiD